MCLPVSMYSSRSITWADLRGRGLQVHVYIPVACVDQWYPVEHSLVIEFIHPTKHHHTTFHPACVESREGGGGNPWRTVTTALSESRASPPIQALIRSLYTVAEIEVGAIEIQTEVGYWLMSGTEEVRS